jgi:hypothetical protein
MRKLPAGAGLLSRNKLFVEYQGDVRFSVYAEDKTLLLSEINPKGNIDLSSLLYTGSLYLEAEIL